MILAFFGLFQTILALFIIALIGLYVFALIKLWRSNLNTLTKIMYTLLVLAFPVLGLILLFLLTQGIVFKVSKEELK